MRLSVLRNGATLAVPALAFALSIAGSAAQQSSGPSSRTDVRPPEASANDIDGPTMFATSCGYCHHDGGRTAGKGPKLAGSRRSDEYIVERIRKGKLGAMPAFGDAFSDGQIIAILAYIRGLEDDGN